MSSVRERVTSLRNSPGLNVTVSLSAGAEFTTLGVVLGPAETQERPCYMTSKIVPVDCGTR